MSTIVSGFIFLVFSPAASARNLPSVAKDEKNKDWHSGYNIISLSHAMRPGLQSAIFGWQNYWISQILFQE